MATKPTPGGSDGTYGTELNEFLDVSLAADGKIKTEALQTDATAPVANAALANKKYVDDNIVKAWVKVNASDTLLDSKNVTSAIWSSVGVLDITWDTDFGNANYVVSAIAISPTTTYVYHVTAQTTGAITVKFATTAPVGETPSGGAMIIAEGNQ